MKILAIETSCDDTCVAILEVKDEKTSRFKILSNIVSSQVKLHAKYSGVYPFLAKREHQKNLPIVFEKALKEAKNPELDLIAVTNGPGLEPCLWVGVNFAVDLAKKLKIPVSPTNHIEAHILANWLQSIGKVKDLSPAICLVVSGGHTQLILMKGFGNYKILGETRDDAAGECFDKTARILGLGYPGGPAIAAAAARYKMQNAKYKIQLPRPMIYQKNYDFSFSGLKTAVLYLYQKSLNAKHYRERSERFQIKNQKFKQAVCYEIQQAVIDVLIHKTLKAAKDYKTKSIILGGGVAANQELRKQFKQKIKKEIPNSLFMIPDSKFCTDNAVMVGIVAYFNFKKKRRGKLLNIEASANLRLK